jgi:hypothetical protein
MAQSANDFAAAVVFPMNSLGKRGGFWQLTAVEGTAEPA